MRIKIWHKLFLAILLVVMVVLAVNLGLSRFGFLQGFSQYIEEVKLKRLDGLRQQLSTQYQEQGSWDFLREDPKQWHWMLLEEELVPPRPPHRGGPPPWRGGGREEAEPFREGRDGFGPSGFPPPLRRGRLGLLDAEQLPIIGPPPGRRIRLLEITVEGAVVGYLTVPNRRLVRTELEHRFAHQQMENLLLTAALSSLIAIVAALLLARLFNRPITRLAEMARLLSEGKFERRMAVKGRDELSDLAIDLNHLAEALEQNRTARQRWIADISHELRTPLTVLRGELEALEDGVRPMTLDSVQSLSLEVRQLKRLVDDLYQLSLSDQGSLSYEKEWVDPSALLQGVVAGFEHALQQSALQLTLECEVEVPSLFADPQRLTQLFTNLLENSQRYTGAGGVLKVWCELEDGFWNVHIEDSAPGVAEHQLERLFDRLYRVEASRNREHGGSGLGLSIARAIAEAHGGTLTARSSALGGLWITLQLPLER